MAIEPKTHPDNIDIISRATAALYQIIKKSLEGQYIIRQRINGISVTVTDGKEFQNLDKKSEPEMLVTVTLNGAPSRSFNFKFSELELEQPVSPVVDNTIPTKDETNAGSNNT